MIQKVLVVGGSGYIGGSVTDLLASSRISFDVFDNLTYEHHYLKPVSFIYGDIRDRKKLLSLLPNYSHVIWLAALVGDGACAIHPNLTWEINAEAVKWVSQNFNGRILFTSTCSVYGASQNPVHEDSPKQPLSVYAQSKLEAEKYLMNKNSLVFRLGTAYGVSDTYSRLRMDLAVNYMTMLALTTKQLKVFGGNQWRPFIHVKDIGRFLVNQLDSQKNGIFNVATQNLQIQEMAKIISQHTQCQIVTTDQLFQDQRNYHADVRKAQQAGILSSPYLKIEDGMLEIKKIIEEKRIQNVNLDLYSNERRMLSIMGTYLKEGKTHDF